MQRIDSLKYSEDAYGDEIDPLIDEMAEPDMEAQTLVDYRSKQEPRHQMPAEERAVMDLASCEPHEFADEMVAQFGKKIFDQGFNLIKLNRLLIYEEDGDKKLEDQLRVLGYEDDTQLRLFIDMCSTYLLL